MGGFGGGAPTVQPAPVAAPAEDPAKKAEQDAAAEAERRRRQASGRAANILTSPLGVPGAAPTATAQLLGPGS